MIYFKHLYHQTTEYYHQHMHGHINYLHTQLFTFKLAFYWCKKLTNSDIQKLTSIVQTNDIYEPHNKAEQSHSMDVLL